MNGGFERYKKDIDKLVEKGGLLTLALQREFSPNEVKNLKDEELKKLPDVGSEYEPWYSEALALISQILPERVDDFLAYYKPKSIRKEITHANYTMSDYLRGLTVRRGMDIIVGPRAALVSMYQQFNIVRGLKQRFVSTLFDIKTLVHADLLESELEAAEELNKKGFQRGAGAVAGVVLEGHLGSVRSRHGVASSKKDPAISDLNDALKAANIIDVATWRFVQHLGDIRNKCDHKKSSDPTKTEVDELIAGVRKITKTVL